MKLFLTALISFLIPSLARAQEAAEVGLDKQIDQAFKPVSDFFSALIFFEIAGTPFVLILLVFSAAFFTLYFGVPNIRYFGKAINTVRGKYDEIEHRVDTSDQMTSEDEKDEGEVSHFQALATAVTEISLGSLWQLH